MQHSDKDATLGILQVTVMESGTTALVRSLDLADHTCYHVHVIAIEITQIPTSEFENSTPVLQRAAASRCPESLLLSLA